MIWKMCTTKELLHTIPVKKYINAFVLRLRAIDRLKKVLQMGFEALEKEFPDLGLTFAVPIACMYPSAAGEEEYLRRWPPIFCRQLSPDEVGLAGTNDLGESMPARTVVELAKAHLEGPHRHALGRPAPEPAAALVPGARPHNNRSG